MNYPPQAPLNRPPSPNLVLAVVSVSLGVIGIFGMIPTLVFSICGIVPIAFGIGAVITGLLGRSKAKRDPANWGGGGLALTGAIVGAVSVFAAFAFIIIWLVLMFGLMAFG